MGDIRDQTTWVTVELNKFGEKLVLEGKLEKRLRKDLKLPPDFAVFVPAKTYRKNNITNTFVFMEGYAFVASGLPEISYFRLEHDTKYVERILSMDSSSGIRSLQTIRDRDLRLVRKEMDKFKESEIQTGSFVSIVNGIYKGIEKAEVIGDCENPEEVFVHIRLRSLERIVVVQKAYLEPFEVEEEEDEEEDSP